MGFAVGLVPVLPVLQYQIFGPHSLKLLFVNGSNYGLSGLGSGRILLTKRTIGSDVLHKGSLRIGVQGTPLNNVNITFLTHFSAAEYTFFYYYHLEQLSIACPNLQQLNLRENPYCLTNLQGLRAIATGCQKLEGLNITRVPVKAVESCVRLWEILVDLQLTYLSIDLCCLLYFKGDALTKSIIISLHQKCLKMKALESHCFIRCAECARNKKQPLLLSYFPLLIHCLTADINDVNICEKLKYLWYIGENIWWPWSVENCNLQQLCIESEQLALPDSFMNKISAHGGLVHVNLIVKCVTQNGIVALLENSPNLITYHVYIGTTTDWFISFDLEDFRSTLEKK